MSMICEFTHFTQVRSNYTNVISRYNITWQTVPDINNPVRKAIYFRTLRLHSGLYNLKL